MSDRKVRIIDKKSEYFGLELEGSRFYYDHLHTGDSADIFVIKTPSGKEEQILSTSVDVNHYDSQLRTENIKNLGANVGDKVMIIETGSGTYCRGWDLSKPHVITKISSAGHVHFDDYPNEGACIFRPKVERLEKRCECG